MAGELSGLGVGGGGGGQPARYESVSQLERRNRRLQFLQQNVPSLVDQDPGAAIALASSPSTDEDLIESALAATGMADISQNVEYLRDLPDDVARGTFAGYTRFQQQAIRASGYEPPSREDKDEDTGILDSVMDGLGRAVSTVADTPMSPLWQARKGLEVADTVLSGPTRQFNRLVRAESQLTDEAGGKNGILDNLVGGHVSLLREALSGDWGDISKAWKDAEHGDYFLRPSDMAVFEEMAGDDAALYMDLSARKDPLDIIRDRGLDPGTPEGAEMFQELIGMVNSDQYKEAHSFLKNHQVTYGRQVARLYGKQPGEEGAGIISGIWDGSLYLVLDPTSYAAPAVKAARLSNTGLYAADFADLYQMEARIAAMRRGNRMVAEPITMASQRQFLADAGPRVLKPGQTLSPAGDKIFTELRPGRITRLSRRIGLTESPVNQMDRVANDIRRAYDPAIEGYTRYDLARDHPRLLNAMTDLEKFNTRGFTEKGLLTVDEAGNPTLEGVFDFWNHKYGRNALLATNASGNATDVRFMPTMTRGERNRAVTKKWFQEGFASWGTGDRGLDVMAVSTTRDVAGGSVLDDVGELVGDAKPSALRRTASTPSRFLQSFVRQQTWNPSIPLSSQRSLSEFRNLLNMGMLGEVPSSVVKEYFNAFASGSVATRRTLVHNFVKDMFTRTGLLSDAATRPEMERKLGMIREMYGLADDGTPIADAILPSVQTAQAMAVPDMQAFIQATNNLGFFRRIFGSATAAQMHAVMGNVWKPSVVMRPGFIPRAVGDELLRQWADKGPISYYKTRVLNQRWLRNGTIEGLVDPTGGRQRKGFERVTRAKLGLGPDDPLKNVDGEEDLYEFAAMRPMLWAMDGVTNLLNARGKWAGKPALVSQWAEDTLVEKSLWAGGKLHEFALKSGMPTKAEIAQKLTKETGIDLTTGLGNDAWNAQVELIAMLAPDGYLDNALLEELIGASHIGGTPDWMNKAIRAGDMSVPRMNKHGEIEMIKLRVDPSNQSISINPVAGQTGELHEYGADLNTFLQKYGLHLEHLGQDPAALAGIEVMQHNVSDRMVGQVESLIPEEFVAETMTRAEAEALRETRLMVGPQQILDENDELISDIPGRIQAGDMPGWVQQTQTHIDDLSRQIDDLERGGMVDEANALVAERAQQQDLLKGLSRIKPRTYNNSAEKFQKVQDRYSALDIKDRLKITKWVRTKDVGHLEGLRGEAKLIAEVLQGAEERVQALVVNRATRNFTALNPDELLPHMVQAMKRRMSHPDSQVMMGSFDRARGIPGGRGVIKPLPDRTVPFYAPAFDSALHGSVQTVDHRNLQFFLEEELINAGMQVDEAEVVAADLVTSFFAADSSLIGSVTDARAVRAPDMRTPATTWATPNEDLALAMGRALDSAMGQSTSTFSINHAFLDADEVARSTTTTPGLAKAINPGGRTWDQLEHFELAPEVVTRGDLMAQPGKWYQLNEYERLSFDALDDYDQNLIDNYLDQFGGEQLTSPEVLERQIDEVEAMVGEADGSVVPLTLKNHPFVHMRQGWEDWGGAPGAIDPRGGMAQDEFVEISKDYIAKLRAEVVAAGNDPQDIAMLDEAAAFLELNPESWAPWVTGPHDEMGEEAAQNIFRRIDPERLETPPGDIVNPMGNAEIIAGDYGQLFRALEFEIWFDNYIATREGMIDPQGLVAALRKVEVLPEMVPEHQLEQMATRAHYDMLEDELQVTHLEDTIFDWKNNRPHQFADGISQGEAYEHASAVLGQDLLQALTGPQSKEVLHELMHPLQEGSYRKVDAFFRGQAQDLPLKTFGPQYYVPESENVWKVFQRKVFEGQIGPMINGMIRNQQFIETAANTLKFAKANAEGVLIDKKARSEAMKLLSGLENPISPDDLMGRWRGLDDALKRPNASTQEVAIALDLPSQLNGQDIATIRRYVANQESVQKVIAQQVMDRSFADMIQFIDHHSLRSMFQQYVGNFVPFHFAEEQFVKRWARTLYRHPEAIRRAQLAMMGLRNTGVIHDDEFGNEVISYPGTGFMQETMGTVMGAFGWDIKQAIPLKMTGGIQYTMPGFDIATDGWHPGLSPLITAPLRGLTSHVPELRRAEEGILGERAKRDNVLEYFIPSSMTKAYRATFGYDEDAPEVHAAINQAGMYLIYSDPTGDKGMGLPERPTPRQLEDFKYRAESYARNLMLMKSVLGFVGPVAPSVTDPEDLSKASDEWDPDFLDYLRSGMDLEDAIPAYVENYKKTHDGKDPTPFTVFASQSVSGARMGQTAEALEFMEGNETYLKNYTHAAPWLIPTTRVDDKYEQRAYFKQMEMGLREKKSPDEWIEDYIFATAAGDYFEMSESYRSARLGMEPGPERAALDDRWSLVRSQYMRHHPLFEQMLTSNEGKNKRKTTIAEMRLIVNDPEAPDAPHLDGIRMLMDGWDYMTSVRQALKDDRRAAALDRKTDVREAFIQWAELLTTDRPELRTYYESVLWPELGVEGSPEDYPSLRVNN